MQLESSKLNWTLHNYESIDSTNKEAFKIYDAQGNDCLPNIITANKQTAGKGQFERNWESPEGNLYCSFSLSKSFIEWKLQQRMDEAKLTEKLGELVYKSIRERFENNDSSFEKLTIKKPNDILFDNAKLAGILVEAKRDLVVIGIGINTIIKPERIEQNSSTQNAISLKECLQNESKEIDLNSQLLESISHGIEQLLD